MQNRHRKIILWGFSAAMVFTNSTCNREATFSEQSFSLGKITGEQITESFEPNSESIDNLDILLVIDASESMAGVRDTLSQKLTPLLSKVQDRDWQIAITTTNASDCFRAVIEKDTENYEQVYRDAIDGICSADGGGCSNFEEAIKMAINGLRGLPLREDNTCDANEPVSWLRNAEAERSAIAIIIVTDADHQCHEQLGQGCEIQDLADFIGVTRVLNRNARVYGFLNLEDNANFLAWQHEGESIFTRYEDYKSSNYGLIFEEISQDLGSVFQYTYRLKHTYNDEASRVHIVAGGEPIELSQDDYGITGNKLIIITTVSALTTKVVVTYSYDP